MTASDRALILLWIDRLTAAIERAKANNDTWKESHFKALISEIEQIGRGI